MTLRLKTQGLGCSCVVGCWKDSAPDSQPKGWGSSRLVTNRAKEQKSQNSQEVKLNSFLRLSIHIKQSCSFKECVGVFFFNP